MCVCYTKTLLLYTLCGIALKQPAVLINMLLEVLRCIKISNKNCSKFSEKLPTWIRLKTYIRYIHLKNEENRAILKNYEQLNSFTDLLSLIYNIKWNCIGVQRFNLFIFVIWSVVDVSNIWTTWCLQHLSTRSS